MCFKMCCWRGMQKIKWLDLVKDEVVNIPSQGGHEYPTCNKRNED